MITLLLTVAAAAHPPVVVSSLDTSRLIQDCRGPETDRSYNFCSGYVMGAFDTLSLTRAICPSVAGDSTIQAIAAARTYINAHPERWSAAPSFLVRDALKAAFPCKRR